MAKIYLPAIDIAEKMLNKILELAPGMLTYELVLEVRTQDPNLAAFLKTIAGEIEKKNIPAVAESQPQR